MARWFEDRVAELTEKERCQTQKHRAGQVREGEQVAVYKGARAEQMNELVN